MRENRMIHLCAIWVLTSLVLGTTGCATAKIVPGPDRVHVTVYPMHGGGVIEPMAEVARLQCRGNGFLLLSVDKKRVSQVEKPRDYVEVLPGRHTLLLMPGRKLYEGSNPFSTSGDTWEWAYAQYALPLDAKPNAWYHFCTYVIEEREVAETVTQTRTKTGEWVETRTSNSRVRYAPFEVLEIIDGKATKIATSADFHRL